VFALKNFAKYLSYNRDNNELLLFLLKQLINDQLSYQKHKSKGILDIEEVTIKEDDFIERVRYLIKTIIFELKNKSTFLITNYRHVNLK